LIDRDRSIADARRLLETAVLRQEGERPMQGRFIGPNEPIWAALLASIWHDVYHLPGYVTLSAAIERAEPVAFLFQEGACAMLIPLLLKWIDPALAGPGLRDAVSPYGYPSPLLISPHGEPDPAFVDRALDAFADELRQQDIVAAFVRLHPLSPFPAVPLDRLGCLVQHGETVSVDLTLSTDEIMGQTRANHRRDLRRLQERGYVARVDETWERFDDFVEIYRETMDRLGAVSFYHFSDEYFAGLRETMGDRLHLFVVERDGDVTAAGLFFTVGGTVQYHLGGSRAAYAADSPSKMMLDAVRWWAKDRGDRVFHLGGGRGGQADSLFTFKAGFSSIRHPFQTWRVIADRAAYDRLATAWSARSGLPPADVDGFFPAYRQATPTDLTLVRQPPVPDPEPRVIALPVAVGAPERALGAVS
jgi:hypothetical protein